MSVAVSIVDRCAVIGIRGRFVFALRDEFLKSVDQVLAQSEVDTVDVDLAATEYIDSAAIGLLLILRDRLEAAGRKRARITGSKGPVRNVLTMCKLDLLFALD